MPKSFEKARKAIAKKKGPIEAIHQFSRDSKRLHRAQLRDEKLERVAATRKRADRPFIDRAAFFQEALRQNDSQPLTMDAVQDLIREYADQYDMEFSDLKKARRPGRPASAREDLLKIKIEKLEKEYENGFLTPELTTDDGALALDRWEGSWSYLTALKWFRISSDGKIQPSTFPPRGDH